MKAANARERNGASHPTAPAPGQLVPRAPCQNASSGPGPHTSLEPLPSAALVATPGKNEMGGSCGPGFVLSKAAPASLQLSGAPPAALSQGRGPEGRGLLIQDGSSLAGNQGECPTETQAMALVPSSLWTLLSPHIPPGWVRSEGHALMSDR